MYQEIIRVPSLNSSSFSGVRKPCRSDTLYVAIVLIHVAASTIMFARSTEPEDTKHADASLSPSDFARDVLILHTSTKVD